MSETLPDVGLWVLWYATFVVSVTLHEAAHGWTAFRLGDATAHKAGLVTLNPLPHMQRSPFGMLLVPILMLLCTGGSVLVGWASTPCDESWARDHRKKAALMALSGPMANLLLLLIAALLIRGCMLLGIMTEAETPKFAHLVDSDRTELATLLSVLFSLNLVLLVFNLIPLPPLDGSNLIALLPCKKLAPRCKAFVENPVLRGIGIIVALQVIRLILGPIWLFALKLLYL
jgi:Zn-dependent protease